MEIFAVAFSMKRKSYGGKYLRLVSYENRKLNCVEELRVNLMENSLKTRKKRVNKNNLFLSFPTRFQIH